MLEKAKNKLRKMAKTCDIIQNSSGDCNECKFNKDCENIDIYPDELLEKIIEVENNVNKLDIEGSE